MTTITTPRQRTTPPARKKRKDVHPAIPAFVALLGVLLLLYPVFATQHNDVEQQKRANGYTVTVQETDGAALERALMSADKYNSDLAAGVLLDPFLADVVPNTPQYQEYLAQLSDFDAMTQLKVPAADINLPVYHGTSDETLKKGAGHLFGSSLPVGGDSSHTIITGHTGLGDATLFNNLTNVKEGDAIYLNTAGRKLKYVVNDIRVVVPTDVSSLSREQGKDMITLITCTPYGINSHRLLVSGERAPLDEVDEHVVDEVPPIKPTWKWWMVALLVGAILSVIVVSALIIRLLLIRKKQQSDDTDEIDQLDDPVDGYTGQRRMDDDGSGQSVDEILAREFGSSNQTSKARARTRGPRAGAVSVAKILEAKAKKKAEKQADKKARKDAKALKKQQAAEEKAAQKAAKAADSPVDQPAGHPSAESTSGGRADMGRADKTTTSPAASQSTDSPTGSADRPGTRAVTGRDTGQETSPTGHGSDSRTSGRTGQKKPPAADTASSAVPGKAHRPPETGDKLAEQSRPSDSGGESHGPADPDAAAKKKPGASSDQAEALAEKNQDKPRGGRHRIGDGKSLTLQEILERRNKR
ncbi:class C sortase [Corynebacterium mendelii]|uniref:Class C sortase n=1 Tax=Corynebacterium mendelii TaxID=2765362 RepID=A0A939IX65_9CORY|nr:class C sortase [Corynebacterium mendelii]MBN9643748.1 class C sortase [Corynebacterium mendelii]